MTDFRCPFFFCKITTSKLYEANGVGIIISLFSKQRLISAGYQFMLAVMIIWLAWGGASLTWLLVDDVQADSMSQQITNQQTSKVTAVKYNINSVRKLNLFGKSEQTSNSLKQSKIADVKAPETKLNLKLMGLRKGSGSIRSSAIVEGPDKKQHIYYIGDKLPSGGAIVEEIFIQHMIISRQGKYETLTLFTVLNAKKVSEQKKEKSAANFTDLSNSTFITKKLNKYKDLALSEPSLLNGVVNVQPVVDGEQFIGYKLSPGIDSRFFQRAGLRRGDVLTSINGVKLDSPNKVLSLMGSIALSSDLDLTIDRSGEPMSFRYKFK